MTTTRRRVYVTQEQLIDVMVSINHAMPVGIVTRTVPDMRKTGNEYFDRIVKITEANVFANCDWEKTVNNELAREGKERDFTAGERAVDMDRRIVNGKRTSVLDKVLKSGVHRSYFEVHFYGHLKCDVRFLLDGRTEIDKSMFAQFIREPNMNAEAARQGVDPGRARIIRSYMVQSIIELRVFGNDYVVI